MSLRKSVVLFLVVGLCVLQCDKVAAIIGGENAPASRYPYYALLEIEVNGGWMYCGASRIHNDILLTSAGCLEEPFSGVAYIGAGRLDGSNSITQCNMVGRKVHPNFTNRKVENDLMLVRLDPNCNKIDDVSPGRLVKLNTVQARPVVNSQPWAIGLGQLSPTQQRFPPTLQHVELNLIGTTACNSPTSYNGDIIGNLQLCAGSTFGFKDTCFGDAGGPLIIRTGGGVAGDVLVGVTSGGEQGKCGDKNFPGIYTRVYNYQNWIKTEACNMSQKKKGLCAAPSFCFSSDATVTTADRGVVPMSELEIGDQVLVSTSGKFDTVYSFGHRDSSTRVNFLQIWTTPSKKSAPAGALEISSNHLVFVVAADGAQRAIPASLVRVGDTIVSTLGDAGSVVQEIKEITRIGAFAPFTYSGTIIVDGLLVSSYVSLDNTVSLKIFGLPVSHHFASHLFESPHRIASRLGLVRAETYTKDGISTWMDVPLQFSSNWLLHQHALLQSVILLPFMCVFGLSWLVETLLFFPISNIMMMVVTIGFAVLTSSTRAFSWVRRGKSISY